MTLRSDPSNLSDLSALADIDPSTGTALQDEITQFFIVRNIADALLDECPID